MAQRNGNGQANRRVFVYAAGGYYWPGQGLEGLEREMRRGKGDLYAVMKALTG